jgi:hypothetical protein
MLREASMMFSRALGYNGRTTPEPVWFQALLDLHRRASSMGHPARADKIIRCGQRVKDSVRLQEELEVIYRLGGRTAAAKWVTWQMRL